MKQEKIDFPALENIALEVLTDTANKLNENKAENVRYIVKSSKGEFSNTHKSFTIIELIREKVREDKSLFSEYVTTLVLSESGIELDPADEFHTLTVIRTIVSGLDQWQNTLDKLKEAIFFKFYNVKVFSSVNGGPDEQLWPRNEE